MKAYVVSDRKGYSDYSVIVFAETPGKAVALALGTDEFQRCDWDFTELKANRIKALDQSYRGHWCMDWGNMDDRLAMVKEAGYRCDPDYVELDDCRDCPAKEYCGGYEQMMEDNQDG